jgi:hypothetical protein
MKISFIKETLEELLVLLDRPPFLFFLFLFLELLTQQLGSRHPSDLNQLPWLEPAISQLKFIPHGFPQEVKLVDRAAELGTDIGILLVSEMPMLILPEIVPVKAALQGE